MFSMYLVVTNLLVFCFLHGTTNTSIVLIDGLHLRVGGKKKHEFKRPEDSGHGLTRNDVLGARGSGGVGWASLED